MDLLFIVFGGNLVISYVLVRVSETGVPIFSIDNLEKPGQIDDLHGVYSVEVILAAVSDVMGGSPLLSPF